MSGHFPIFLGLTRAKQKIKFLAKGHNPVPPVSLKPATLPFQVYHSTTELQIFLDKKYRQDKGLHVLTLLLGVKNGDLFSAGSSSSVISGIKATDLLLYISLSMF